ncbi:Kynurenine 3-monooxygenase (Kynurenine 3-hydroxylase) [Durusdinium trenchii]|uniref:Kynurenine 3-monooxygenase (Kynurenine 3-hydroxylase) n=1 Tax=Durusdinium trenchii TaxID=1381693 RepID=A0ABP0HUC3_9DINO
MELRGCWLLILQVFPGCAGIPFCDPEYLSAVGCPEVEHGIDWQVFLEGTCEKCPPNEPCQLDFEDTAFQLAQVATAGGAEGAPHFRCAPGLLSTMIIIAQYFLVKEPTPEVAKILGTGASLAPFPFYTSQYSRYANMVPMNLLLCNTQQSSAPSMYNRYVPRVHAEDSGFCGLVYTDDQLVRRCRSLRQNANVLARVGSTLDSLERIQCPAFEELKVEEGLGRKIQKYQDRANQLQCQDSRGMWHEAMSDIHKCVLITVGHWLRFRPGELVLDWGSGCGHKLSWAKMLFDVEGVGVEIQEPAVRWAQSHSAGMFCHGDGRNLSWLPELTFDHVISYASIYHLEKHDQCSVGIQLVRKLKIGGRAFLGWNHGPVMSNWEWLRCFEDSHEFVKEHDIAADGVEVDFDAVEDGYLFPPNANVLEVDLVLGCDGIRSAVRGALQAAGARVEQTRFQDRRPIVYRVLAIPTGKEDSTELNYSVRKDNVIVEALPNVEGDLLGVVLFRPTDERIEGLKSGAEAKKVFEELFPEWPTPMITDEEWDNFAARKTRQLPRFAYAGPELNLGGKCCLLGDAIHSVKPFFGLGLNSGFEDISVLDQCLGECDAELSKALPLYTRRRAPEAKCLVRCQRRFDQATDLAFALAFVLPIVLDSIFRKLLPSVFAPGLLALFQDGELSFTTAERRKRRDRILQAMIICGVLSLLGAGAFLSLRTVARLLWRCLSPPVHGWLHHELM